MLFTFTRGDEKKHSVVYKCKLADGPTFSIYIPKETGLTNEPVLLVDIRKPE